MWEREKVYERESVWELESVRMRGCERMLEGGSERERERDV